MDEFGHRLTTTGTTRPPGIPADDWILLSVKQREKAITEYREAKEGIAKSSGGPSAGFGETTRGLCSRGYQRTYTSPRQSR